MSIDLFCVDVFFVLHYYSSVYNFSCNSIFFIFAKAVFTLFRPQDNQIFYNVMHPQTNLSHILKS